MDERSKVGKKGEKLAAEYLLRKGYLVLARNYRNLGGEIDLIAQDGAVIVMVEVKTKTGDSYGAPWEMVGAWKLQQIEKVSQGWRWEYEYQGEIRIDVVGVKLKEGGEEIEYYQNVTS